MATVVARVDKTSVNYESIFIYTIDASFNGITGSINSAYIKMFLPNTINFTPGDIQKPVKEIRYETVAEGKNIIFDFGSIKDLGIAARLGIGGQYKLEAANGTTFSAIPELWINGSLYIQEAVEMVTLNVKQNFEIRQEVVLPTISPAPGGSVYYKVILENFGDKGTKVENVVISIPASEGMVIDSTYNPGGFDKSVEKFADKTQDRTLATISENQLTFTLTQYRGSKYEFFYRINLDKTLQVGSNIVTICNLTIDNVEELPYTDTIVLGQPVYSVAINKYGPDYTLPGEYINYELNVMNNGNQNLSQVHIMDNLSSKVQYESFRTGIFYIGGINQVLDRQYFIEYTTVNGQSGTLGPFSTNINTTVDLRSIVVNTDNISSLSWNLPILGVGVKDRVPPHINGRVKEETTVGTTILNHYHVDWNTEAGEQSEFINQTTLVQNVCVMMPLFKRISPQTPVKPGDIIRYQMGVNCRKSRLCNPIIAMLLPKELKYAGNLTVQYSDYFNEKPTPQTPPVRIIENFRNTGRTLVKLTYEGSYSYDFNQKAIIAIEFDTKVRIGAIGIIKANMVVNTLNSTGVIASGYDVYEDILNIAEDVNVSTEYASSRVNSNEILFFASASSDKKVKGALDTVFTEEPAVGRTTEGGAIQYKIVVTNTGNTNLKSIDIVDVLPHIGDLGVIEVRSSRLSEFIVYNTNEITGILNPTVEGQSQVEVEILYSRSYNPVRFGNAFQTIGSIDDWTTTMPTDATDIKAFRVRTKNTELYPDQSLEVTINAVAPVGIVPNKVAWNSFAADVTYIDRGGRLQHLLAVEPEKVGVKVVDLEPGKGQIGGFAWFDEDGDGRYENQNSGINDIGVVLYDKGGRAIGATFTAPNNEGIPGHYLFSNLEMGQYFIRFFIDDIEYQFTKQRLDVINGSKANEKTGITPKINLQTNLIQRSINVGITPIDRMKYILEINNGARRMLRNVVYNQMLIGMKYEDVQELIK